MIEKKDLRKKDADIVWCAGEGFACGYYNFLNQLEKVLTRYMNENGLEKNSVHAVSGIGCSSRLPTYQDLCTYHTTHGNSASFTEGIALATKYKEKKDLVYCVGGDGDHLAIGLSNFMNICRDNLDVTLFVLNNEIYGMTSGQTSPTTPKGTKTSSAPHGCVEEPWDPVTLALGAGATYVARTSAFPQEAAELEQFISEAFGHKGTSVVIVDSPCPTQNPLHKRKKSKEIYQDYSERSIRLKDIRLLDENFAKGKVYCENPLIALIKGEEKLLLVNDAGLKILAGKKSYYYALKEIFSANKVDLMIRGKIFEEQRQTLTDAMLEQKNDVLAKYQDKTASGLAKELLKKYKI